VTAPLPLAGDGGSPEGSGPPHLPMARDHDPVRRLLNDLDQSAPRRAWPSRLRRREREQVEWHSPATCAPVRQLVVDPDRPSVRQAARHPLMFLDARALAGRDPRFVLPGKPVHQVRRRSVLTGHRGDRLPFRWTGWIAQQWGGCWSASEQSGAEHRSGETEPAKDARRASWQVLAEDHHAGHDGQQVGQQRREARGGQGSTSLE